MHYIVVSYKLVHLPNKVSYFSNQQHHIGAKVNNLHKAKWLGLDVLELQPTGCDDLRDTMGNLRFLHTKLGSGYVLGGSCEGSLT